MLSGSFEGRWLLSSNVHRPCLCDMPYTHVGLFKILDPEHRMKTDVNKKLLKLISAEVLMQIGFERSTEQSLGILTEVFSHFIERIIMNIRPIQNGRELDGQEEMEKNETHAICRFLMEDTYRDEQYQIKECMKFLEQQILLKMQLAGKHNIECEESLLHSLKLLPKGVTLRSVSKNTRTATLEEKKSAEITEDVQIDEYMNEFIGRSASEASRRVVEGYSFDCSKIVDYIDGNGLVPFERIACVPRDQICDFRDFFLAEQELFTEDFSGTHKYRIYR